MNNIPIFPPAERFGLSLIALIRAIAAQAGWFVPNWLVAKVEAEIWGFVEALSLLIAVVAERNAAAAAAEQTGRPVQASETEAAGRRGNPRRTTANPARKAKQGAAAGKAPQPEQSEPSGDIREATDRPTVAPPPRPESPRHGIASAHWPRDWPNPKTAWTKPAPWHVYNVTMSK